MAFMEPRTSAKKLVSIPIYNGSTVSRPKTAQRIVKNGANATASRPARGLTNPLKKTANSRGRQIVEPLRPMERMLHLRIRELRLPETKERVKAEIKTMEILENNRTL